jgi:signal transduction histidine kinase
MGNKFQSFCFLSAFILLTPFFSYSQTNTIRGLKKNLLQAVTDDQQLAALLTLCEQGYNLHADTLIKYALEAKQLAARQESISSSIRAQYFQSYGLTNKGLIDSSIHVADRCLEALEAQPDDPVLKGNLYNQKGRCYMRKSQYIEAIEMGYKVISMGEKAQNVLLQMQGKTLIGWANLEMDRPTESLKWHLAALRTTNDPVEQGKYSILFANLSLNYSALGKMDSAFYYINKAVGFSRQYENLFALSNSLAIQAQLFIRSGQSVSAEAPLEEVIAIRKLIGDPFYIVSDMAQLGLYYAANGQADKGIALVKDGLNMAYRYNIDTKLFFLYSTLAENYKAKEDYVKYAETLEKIISIKDSVYQKNSEAALAEVQKNYELQKRENTIINQQLAITRRNYLFYSSIALSLVILLSAFFLFRNFRKRQRLKMELMLQQEKRFAADAIKEAEEKERKRIAADLHDNLGAYAASLASNVDLIKRQYPERNGNYAYDDLKNNSQAIISQLNDTIWVLKKESLTLTAISDKIKVFIKQIQVGFPGVTIDVDESIDNDFQLPPSQAFNLYRVVQEAINNALKHSKGDKVLIKITSTSNWMITIADNGKGLSRQDEPASGQGNGIANMRNRCKEAGWNIEWAANDSGGNIVIISPTTN